MRCRLWPDSGSGTHQDSRSAVFVAGWMNHRGYSEGDVRPECMNEGIDQICLD